MMRATWGGLLLCGLASCLTPHPMDGGIDDGEADVPVSPAPDVASDLPAPDVGCPAGQSACDGGCVDLALDPTHCGACGVVCAAGESCCSTRGMIACAALASDPNNCGTCGTTCGPDGECNAGVCRCLTGGLNCGTGGAVVCVNPLTDPSNCGGCGSACVLPHVAISACGGGMCAVGTCAAGYADCDGIATNGCEVNTQADSANCCECGNVCASGQVCMAGACTSMDAGTAIDAVATDAPTTTDASADATDSAPVCLPMGTADYPTFGECCSADGPRCMVFEEVNVNDNIAPEGFGDITPAVLCVHGTCTACAEGGQPCTMDYECCVGSCEGGFCAYLNAGVGCYGADGAFDDHGLCLSGICLETGCDCSHAGGRCHGDSDCCFGTCLECGCMCTALGSACTNDRECCSGRCDGGVCACALTGTTDCCNFRSFMEPLPLGTCGCGGSEGVAECSSSAYCPMGSVCGAMGYCCTPVGQTPVCNLPCCYGFNGDGDPEGMCLGAQQGGACGSDSDCALGTCAAGVCTCLAPGTTCTDGTDCCSGTCAAGHCGCLGAYAFSVLATNCCSAALDGAEFCACSPVGGRCNITSDCCTGSCTDGSCR